MLVPTIVRSIGLLPWRLPKLFSPTTEWANRLISPLINCPMFGFRMVDHMSVGHVNLLFSLWQSLHRALRSILRTRPNRSSGSICMLNSIKSVNHPFLQSCRSIRAVRSQVSTAGLADETVVASKEFDYS